jgi:hypothetical protein
MENAMFSSQVADSDGNPAPVPGTWQYFALHASAIQKRHFHAGPGGMGAECGSYQPRGAETAPRCVWPTCRSQPGRGSARR